MKGIHSTEIEMPMPFISALRSQPMKVFLFTADFAYGGTERYILNLVRHIDSEKFAITVGCCRRDGPFQPPPGIQVVEFPLRGFRWILMDLPILAQLILFLRKSEFNLIYATHFHTNIYLSLVAVFCRKPALVLGYRGINRIQSKIGKALTFFCSKLAHTIMVNSESASSVLRDMIGVPSLKIRVVKNGIEYNQCSARSMYPPTKGKVIGTVGRLHKLKGHKYLLRAFKDVERTWPETTLLLVGDGEERAALEHMAGELGISSKVTFAGYREDIGSILNKLDIFVLPSLTESFPNALLEAMAHGVPSIATRVGGAVEIIEDGKDGLLVPPSDAEQLATAISSLLKDSTLSNTLRAGGHAKAALFSIENMVRETERVFEEAISAKYKFPLLKMREDT
jgi:glycosyltransferase involved in cell wall biosynthesis